MDRIQNLPVGAGAIDLTAYLHGNTSVVQSGAAIGIQKHTTKNLSYFGDAWVGANAWLGPQPRVDLDYGVLAGLRYTF